MHLTVESIVDDKKKTRNASLFQDQIFVDGETANSMIVLQFLCIKINKKKRRKGGYDM